MDFTEFDSLAWPPPESPKVGEVYVLLFKRGEQHLPFYVGQTQRFLERIGDYVYAHFGACTDFKVGEAIKFLQTELGCAIVAKHRASVHRFNDELDLIKVLRQEAEQ